MSSVLDFHIVTVDATGHKYDLLSSNETLRAIYSGSGYEGTGLRRDWYSTQLSSRRP